MQWGTWVCEECGRAFEQDTPAPEGAAGDTALSKLTDDDLESKFACMADCWGLDSEFTLPLKKERERRERAKIQEAEKLSTADGRLQHAQKQRQLAVSALDKGKARRDAAEKDLRSTLAKLADERKAYESARDDVTRLEGECEKAKEAYDRALKEAAPKAPPTEVVREWASLAKDESVLQIFGEFGVDESRHEALLARIHQEYARKSPPAVKPKVDEPAPTSPTTPTPTEGSGASAPVVSSHDAVAAAVAALKESKADIVSLAADAAAEASSVLGTGGVQDMEVSGPNATKRGADAAGLAADDGKPECG